MRFNPYLGGTLLSTAALAGLLAWPEPSRAVAPPSQEAILEKQFTTTVRPFLVAYCAGCHGKDKPQAQLNLVSYTQMATVVRDFSHWTLLRDRLINKDMPPAGIPQPPDKDRLAVIAWINAVRNLEIQKHAGDPGLVPARRLSNREYDYTIRDLTGQDLQPTKEFPVDPANQEGFDNSAESLTLSGALTKKYVQAARDVADHLALTSTGFAFASHPVIGETDRDKFCSLRIVDFYKRQPTDIADYFYGAWHYKYRAELGKPDYTLPAIANELKISPKYLERVWAILNAPDQTVGPVAQLQKSFNGFPKPDPANPKIAYRWCVTLREWVTTLRRKVSSRFPNLKVPNEFSTGSQCNILWKDRQYATHRRTFNPAPLQLDGVPHTRVIPARDNRPERTVTEDVDPDLFAPLDETARVPYIKGFDLFCDTFPDAFYIDERGLMEFDQLYLREGRLLTAGSHNAMGYFRDDTPLVDMILDEKGKQELDTLWRDFSNVASWQERMHLQFFFYERNEARTILTGRDPEFDFAKPEDKGNLAQDKIKLFSDLYIAKAKRMGGTPETLAVFDEHFKIVAANIKKAGEERLAAEPVHRKALLEFAEKAYRRPLTDAEKQELLGFYATLRTKDQLTHEDAMRDCVTRVLLSPNFLFRLDLEEDPVALQKPVGNGMVLASTVPPPAPAKVGASTKTTQALSDYALANRLSYFLWASMPDKELMDLAAQKKLSNPAVLAAQTRRMLKSPKMRAMATEFGANWLDFRRFEEHNAVDRQRFPSFDDTLRESMFQEPIHFMMDTFQNNGSVLDWLYGKYTFVNAPLAKHYGMTEVKPEGDGWVKVDDATKYGRGGLLPMAVFLTSNASGLRTSPVKRGYWVVKRVLGEVIPPPPAAVPELPKDEHELGERTLRQALEQHRKNPACAGCHARFDSYGLVFENFGPIGELREKDGGGKPVDNHAPFPGGPDRAGVTGLQDFLKVKREKDFLSNFNRKLVSYGLGRTLLPSDEPLLNEVQKRMAANGYKFNTLVETIVTSQQFRNRRIPTLPKKDA
ncbi:MAG: DUF1592 domain-containing protein [Armatimonas sp.]